MEKQKLNLTTEYILSIVGFLCCCIWGIGAIPAGIAFYMAQNKLKLATLNPENYENVNAVKTAKMIALIVLIINVLTIIFVIYRIATVGWDNIMEESLRMQEEIMKGAGASE